ncbi:MAG: hypothetical protein IKQ35_04165 [Bacilli bacterium]|nr:hypothetical protein [Bacilli bacterium]
MDENKIETNTSNVEAQTSVTNTQPVENTSVQQPQVEVSVEPVQTTSEVKPEVSESATPITTTPVIQAEEEVKNDNPAVVDESKEMIDKNKKILSSSPQMVDSSSINVNQETNNISSESNVVSETVIETDLNNQVLEEEQKQGTFEEVSLSLDSSSLELTDAENDPNSIFNKVDNTNSNAQAQTAKIGEEKHKFPFFMVLILILLIIAAFNIDTVSSYIKNYLNKNKKEEVKEEVKPKKEEIPLKNILAKLDESSIIDKFETTNNIEVSISLDETNNKISFVTSNYIKISEEETITVTFDKDGTDLVATCTDENMSFCEVVTTATVISISRLEETYTKELEDYLNEYITYGSVSVNGFSEVPTSEGRVFRISLVDKISLPETK